MKWVKRGQIFNFLNSTFKNRFISHAQSPQTLIFDDFIRIFFSTRKRTANEKFISIIQFIDIDKSFKNIINYSTSEVLSLGELGTFDEHGIFPLNVVKYDNKVLGYTTGWSRRSSVSIETGIGYVESYDNGNTFERIGNGPVLTSSLQEPFLVCDGFVKVFNNTFHMWYIHGTKWRMYDGSEQPERTYRIAHAISQDGVNWEKKEHFIIEQNFEEECQALPSVIQWCNKYHMVFCYRNSCDFRTNANNGYKLGYAYSDDLINWKRDDSALGLDLSNSGWDCEMMCYPHLFEMENKIFLLYNGNDFGKNGFGLAELVNEK